jgi:hypothetical protein
MNDKVVGGVHWSFWAIGAITLLWNVMGIMNLLWQMNSENLAAMPELHRAIAESRPSWATAAFALAVFGGAVGCLLLLLRKSAASSVLIASFVGMIVHTFSYFGITNSAVSFGPSDIILIVVMPVAVAAFLIWYAKLAASKGWIS